VNPPFTKTAGEPAVGIAVVGNDFARSGVPATPTELTGHQTIVFTQASVRGARVIPEFMARMPAALGVVPAHIAAGDVWIATGVDGEIAGVVALAPGDAPDTLNLNKLFVEPSPYPQRRRPGATRARRRRGASARRRAADDPG
jgi:hypothetical protein